MANVFESRLCDGRRQLDPFARRFLTPFLLLYWKIVEETEPKRKRKKRFRRKERSKRRQCEESCKTKNLSFTDYDLAKFRRMFFIDFLLKNIVFLGILLYLWKDLWKGRKASFWVRSSAETGTQKAFRKAVFDIVETIWVYVILFIVPFFCFRYHAIFQLDIGIMVGDEADGGENLVLWIGQFLGEFVDW